MARASYIEPSLDEWLKLFKFKTEIKVRISETDLSGHVNNTSYFVYFEQARAEFLECLGFYQENIGAVTADLVCHFHGEAFFPNTLVVGVRVAKLSQKSMDLEYYIQSSREHRLVATGRGALVMMDKTAKKSTIIPEPIRKEIEKREISIRGSDPHSAKVKIDKV
ncbi:thioesterase family protein [Neobacillus niacini]|uniref:acyl-CoA thioesterase n=1 Tax=Neobacillus niacini TaxID=86668 RepID=UPI0021CB0112|nr:thioesterase family protein [Neobacillus niacini]MCM3763813.1 acyl-CoA thioesterase [Neobacillus niacini]